MQFDVLYSFPPSCQLNPPCIGEFGATGKQSAKLDFPRSLGIVAPLNPSAAPIQETLPHRLLGSGRPLSF